MKSGETENGSGAEAKGEMKMKKILLGTAIAFALAVPANAAGPAKWNGAIEVGI